MIYIYIYYSVNNQLVLFDDDISINISSTKKDIKYIKFALIIIYLITN